MLFMNRKKFVLYLVLWISVLCIMVYFSGKDMPLFAGEYSNLTVKADVKSIVDRYEVSLSEKPLPFHQGINIEFTAEILTGDYKGKIVSGLQNIDTDGPYNMRELKKGDKVLLTFFSDEEMGNFWLMTEYIRTDFLIILFLIFSACVLLFGKFKGVTTLVSLVLTCLCVFKVLIAAILSGKNIYFWSICVCLYIIMMTLTLISTNRKKCITATLGCAAGALTAGILTIFSDMFLHLTGITNDESLYLKYLIEGGEIDLKAIIFASILIGAVGAIMDVSISISSALYELSLKAEDNSVKSLMSSGMNIGKDMMGTMANTLVLAYMGSSMAMTVLLFAYSSSLLALFNREVIVVEILQAIIGSFSLLLTIPLTSFISAVAFSGGMGRFAKSLIDDDII